MKKMNRRQMLLGLFGVGVAVVAGKPVRAAQPLPAAREPVSLHANDSVLLKFQELSERVEQDHALFMRHITAKVEVAR